MLRRLWGSADVVADAFHAICESFKAPIARDKLQSRLLCLTHGILNSREILLRDSEFERHVVQVMSQYLMSQNTISQYIFPQCVMFQYHQGLLRPLLSELMSGKTSNWRFQLVATAILTVFNVVPIPSLEEDYALWLLSASNPSGDDQPN